MTDATQSHKAFVAGVFDRAADTYDRVGENYHDHFGLRLVEVVEPADGAAWLDVGCGRGAVLVPASSRVGRLAGIDVSPAMISAAEAELARVGAGAELRVMDAEQLEFPAASFDVVSCAFTLPFLPSPGDAVTEFARVLRSGGRVVTASWGESDPRWAWEDALWAEISVARRPARQAFAGPGEVADLLAGAGELGDVREVLERHEIFFLGPEQWWDWLWSFSRRGVLEQMSPVEVEELRREAFERLDGMRTPAGIPMRLTAVFTLASRV